MKMLIFADLILNINANLIFINMTQRLRAFSFLCVLVYISVNQNFAQRPVSNSNQVAILGWVDDTHYLIRNYDVDKKLVTMSVDIRSGKKHYLFPF